MYKNIVCDAKVFYNLVSWLCFLSWFILTNIFHDNTNTLRIVDKYSPQFELTTNYVIVLDNIYDIETIFLCRVQPY